MKKLLKVMAGLVGVAAVAGAGYLVYDHFMGGSEEVDQVIDNAEDTTEEVMEEAPVEETVETEVKTVVDDVDTAEPEL